MRPWRKESGCPGTAAGPTSATCTSGRTYRRRGVGSWLLGQAADWLGLAQVAGLLDYAWLDGTDPGGYSYDDYRAFLPAVGFRELTRTARGWTKD